ncbi:unnamed protein product [Lymnaea stagnalis]|uniref:Leucine-rich repeat-containing protein 46 n=1 Tax=Lymnaea stagnalis TaxID=6523 RepID=A0AAV2HZE1_LYMST
MADNQSGHKIQENDARSGSFDSPFEEKVEKPVRLNLQHIVKRHLPTEASDWSHDEILKALNKIRRVRLDRENISDIDNLELLSTEVTHLYLHCNKITKIENLECLPHLQILILSDNQISDIDGIAYLTKLVFFDISKNRIEETHAEKMPKSLVIVSFSGNPCTECPSHRFSLIQWLPTLKHLDGIEISREEMNQAGRLESCMDEESDEEDNENSENDEQNYEDPTISHLSKNVNEARSLDIQQNIGYKQLPKIQKNIHDLATDMLMRSQSRLEDRTSEYRKHIQEMTNIRILSKIKPVPHLSKPSDSLD